MFRIFKTAALSALIGLAGLTGLAATAHADGLYLNFGDRHDPRVGVYVGDNGSRYDRRWDNDGWRRDRWRERRDCTPGRALDKAERLGLRRARVVDVDRRTIDVAGRRHGERFVITFARAPHCPVVR